MITTRWNGDPSLLKDTDIAELVIDFEDQTFSVTMRDQDYSMRTGYHRNFTTVSSFGLMARGLRRMVSDVFSSDRS